MPKTQAMPEIESKAKLTGMYSPFQIISISLTRHSLRKLYVKHAAKLKCTGGGIDHQNAENDNENEGVEVYMDFYILPEGPNDLTEVKAKNLWGKQLKLSIANLRLTCWLFLTEQITNIVPFFPNLHRIYAARPNINPPAITTGVGPHGRRVVFMQPPDDSVIDPVLRDQELPNSIRLFGNNITNDSLPTAGNAATIQPATPQRENVPPLRMTTAPSTPLSSSQKQVPKLSTATEIAMQKARESIKLIPKKCSFEEGILEIQEYVSYYQFC
jgi:hypothetical protein